MHDRAPLPSEQYWYPGRAELPAHVLHARREGVFLVLAGLFLGTLAILNIIGVTRFVDLSFTVPLLELRVPMPVAVGVLPYPITFLCTDFISELYGRRRANAVVLVGLLLNLWLLFILWIGGELPGVDAEQELFWGIRTATFGAVSASMIAYLAAQLVDVQLFHYWKRRTRGRHLWLRNNGSTLVSQLVDTVAVITITHFYAHLLPVDAAQPIWPQLVTFIAAGYVFKVTAALLDTLPFYAGVAGLGLYLRLPPAHEEGTDTPSVAVAGAGVG